MAGSCGTMVLARAGEDQYVAYPAETIDGGKLVVDCEAGSTTPVDHVVVHADEIGQLADRVDAYLAGDVTAAGETYHYEYSEYDPDEHLLGLLPDGVVIQSRIGIEFTCIECGEPVDSKLDSFGLGNFNLLVHDGCGEAFAESLRTIQGHLPVDGSVPPALVDGSLLTDWE